MCLVVVFEQWGPTGMARCSCKSGYLCLHLSFDTLICAIMVGILHDEMLPLSNGEPPVLSTKAEINV